ncbi:Uncharacterised protein [Serratia liquefaciens]|uniref:hypothetical protein n=1 Tax=Serratia liquefaciens TaxID=614 RepID=UPI002177CE71|nr:hypothetical protein [Serratia liquefaciens]CAI1543388.1 Uncharacterised protein [Serratia liquefaciens]
MSNEKLSELSKPVAYKFDHGVMGPGDFKYGTPQMHSTAKDENASPPYSQEYVSALQADIEYMRWRIKEIDLLFGKNLLAMRAAVIEAENGEGHTAGMQWIFNTLFGPGEFAPENETNAQDYYNREAEKIDVEFSKCMDFFNSQRKAMKEQSNG